MGRNRTPTDYRPIGISLEKRVIDALEQRLKPKDSRSAWIQKAIEDRLNPTDSTMSPHDASTGYLLSILTRREDLDESQRRVLETFLQNWSPQ